MPLRRLGRRFVRALRPRVARRPWAARPRATGPTPRRAGSEDVAISYAPSADGRPDPGEVVWTWVPYEEDASQGKDRPVLILGMRGVDLVGLMLTSKDHDRDSEQEARSGRHWMDIGSGGWDTEQRPSEVRLDRLITVDAARVRREGAALPEPVFRRVVAATPGLG